MTAPRRDLWIRTLLRQPLTTVDATLRTGAELVDATITALRAVPKLVAALEKLTPAVQAAQNSLDRIDSMGTFVASELPETQHQLEQLRQQLTQTAAGISDLGPALIAQASVNRALNESIRLLVNGLGVVQGTTDALGTLLSRLPDVRRAKSTDPKPPRTS